MRFALVLMLSSLSLTLYAGDDLDPKVEMVGLNKRSEFLLLRTYEMATAPEAGRYPAVVSTHRSIINETQSFIELPSLLGLGEASIDEAYGKSLNAKWQVMLEDFRKSGYRPQGYQELKVASNDKGYAEIALPSGELISEVATSLKRRPNELQTENISLWIASKKGAKAKLLKKDVINTVVRSHSHRTIQKAYWLPEAKTVVALYNPVENSASSSANDLWVYRFE